MGLKKKPDLLAVLAIVVGIGVIASSLAQGMSDSPEDRAAQLAAANPSMQAVGFKP